MIKEEMDKIINKVMKEASVEPIALFYYLGFSEHITVQILNQENGDRFELSLKKLKQ